jgi:hypothetical protein
VFVGEGFGRFVAVGVDCGLVVWPQQSTIWILDLANWTSIGVAAPSPPGQHLFSFAVNGADVFAMGPYTPLYIGGSSGDGCATSLAQEPSP